MKIAIIGITGKMGKAIKRLIFKDPALALVGKISSSYKEINIEKADILIDFSSPDALKSSLFLAKKFQKPLVIGTTNLTKNDFKEIEKQATNTAIFYSPNFSIGIHLMKKMANFIAKGFETKTIDILDIHHKEKKDAPSGTALYLQKEIKKIKNNKVEVKSIRRGKVIGEHSIDFINEEEAIIIKHKAFSRDVFAKGALLAAKFLLNKPAKLYTMDDLIKNFT